MAVEGVLLGALADYLAAPGVALLAGLWALAVLLWRQDTVRGTTLRGPWCWTLAAVAGLVLVEGLACWSDLNGSELSWARYLAAVLTACPGVALLGARRPQNRAWQWIVASLWVVLGLAGGQQWFASGRSAVELPAAWGGFLVAVLAVGGANYLCTRWWLPALLVVAGQALAVLPFVLGTAESPQEEAAGEGARYGLLLVGAALAVGVVCGRGWRGGSREDQLWRDFRDHFGAVWSLRIMQRVNAAAALAGRPYLLTWFGFVHRDSAGAEPLPAQEQAAAGRTLAELLWRFVSPEWIARRLNGTLH